MTNVKIAWRAPAAASPGGARRSLIILISSWVIAAMIALIRAYQLFISPARLFLFGPTGGCRFTPTCSHYAMDAIRARGPIAGTWLAAKRICRCHPFANCGHDPVPGSDGKMAAPNAAEI